MGSTKRRWAPFFLPGSLFLVSFLFLFSTPASAQSGVPLVTEISRLERLALGGSTRERYDAYMALAQLQRLSGNPEAALDAYEGALSLLPGDGKALLEQARLLISFGEYEKAVAAASGLLRPEQGREFSLAGRYLGAQAEAFLSGNVQSLAALASDPDFSEYLGAIYYTIWRVSEAASYRNRLTAELPQSPEAGIAGGRVIPAATPLWLLFPGRESIALSPSLPAPAAAQPPVLQTSVLQTSVLQTGLFGRLENAQNFAETLGKAGFAPEIIQRQVNGANYWAVVVPYGGDMNAMIRRLRDAGFESFPISL